MTILFISGINDQSKITLTLDDKGNTVYQLQGNCWVHQRLPLKEDIAATFLLFGKAVKQHSIEFETPPSLIFNQIADADSCRGALERCVEFCEQVDATVVNHPEHVLQTTRDRVSATLQGIPKVIVPKILRFQPRAPRDVFTFASAEGFDYPLIARLTGSHDGKHMVRVDDPGDLPGLHALPFDGRDFYLIQYIDYRSDDGFYHRQRIAVIDSEPILVESLYDSNWNVGRWSRTFMLQREGWDAARAREESLEANLIPALRPAIAEIAKRLQLEYFCIDCSLQPDGSMIVFEANTGQNILYSPYPEMSGRTEAIRQRTYDLLVKYSGEQVI
jgi:hypothetical protein